MDQSSIKDVINSAVIANRENNYTFEKELVSNFTKAIRDNMKLFEEANEIDLKNNNGFKLDNILIDKLLKKYEDVNPLIRMNDEMILMKNNLLKSELYTKLGVILVVFDGNTYTMLEMILLGLLTHNAIIFTYNGYMGGTNGLMINIIQTIFEKENMKKEMFQHSVTIRSQEFFDNYKSINKTIIIGNDDFTSKYLKECTTEAIVSNYNKYDIYIDSLKDIDFIKEILNQKLDFNVYINDDLKIDIEDAVFVSDIDEVISYINYGSKYASAIFTEDNEKAAKFVEMINSKYVMINASPTLEQAFDIKQEDLLKTKNIIMPNIYKFDGTTIEIKTDNG